MKERSKTREAERSMQNDQLVENVVGEGVRDAQGEGERREARGDTAQSGARGEERHEREESEERAETERESQQQQQQQPQRARRDRSAWNARNVNRVTQFYNLSARFPLTTTTASFADRWWLSHLFGTRLGTPYEIISFSAEWSRRFAEFSSLEPLLVLIMYQIPKEKSLLMFIAAMLCYSTGIGYFSLFPSLFDVLIVFLCVPLRLLVWQTCYVLYSFINAQLTVYNNATDNITLDGDDSVTMTLLNDDEHANAHGESGFPTLVCNSRFHRVTSVKDLLLRERWPLLCCQYAVVGAFSVLTAGNFLVGRALYELVPYVDSVCCLYYDIPLREHVPKLLEHGNNERTRFEKAIRTLFYYVVPRVAAAHVLDRFFTTYFFDSSAAPLFVVAVAAIEYVWCCRELSHRIVETQ